MRRIFENSGKYVRVLSFDDLIVKSKNGNIEITDFYVRSSNNILLGEIKSGLIYDRQKYSGDLLTLYKNDRNSFFDNFGVNQIVKSVEILTKHIKDVDPSYSISQNYQVYPCIIVNDTALQTPFMADVFNKRFKELMANIGVHKLNIKPLTVIHISDLERLEDYLNVNPKEFWNLLELNFSDRKFVPPFYSTHEFYVKNLKEPNWMRNLINGQAAILGVS